MGINDVAKKFSLIQILTYTVQVSALGISINARVFGSITGIDDYKINPDVGVSRSLQCLLVSSVILQVSLSVVKVSILFFYKRIFPLPRYQIAAWVCIFFVIVWGIIFFLVSTILDNRSRG